MLITDLSRMETSQQNFATEGEEGVEQILDLDKQHPQLMST